MGRRVPEFDDLRELIFENYRIVYSFEETVVTILAVYRSTMDVIGQLRQLLGDE
jgi:hypothetical protein